MASFPPMCMYVCVVHHIHMYGREHTAMSNKIRKERSPSVCRSEFFPLHIVAKHWPSTIQI